MALFGIYIDEQTIPPARRPTGYLTSVNAETAADAIGKYAYGKAVFVPIKAVILDYECSADGKTWSPLNAPSVLVYLEDQKKGPEEALALRARMDRGDTIRCGGFLYRKRT